MWLWVAWEGGGGGDMYVYTAAKKKFRTTFSVQEQENTETNCI